MKTQDRTIRDVIFDKFYNNFSEQDLPLLNEIAEFAQQLKQPEKQEIEIAEELEWFMATENDTVENRKLIIELQKVVNNIIKNK